MITIDASFIELYFKSMLLLCPVTILMVIIFSKIIDVIIDISKKILKGGDKND